MRLVFISDTHEQHEKLEVPDGDILIHCGDLTWKGEPAAIIKFLDWFEAHPHNHKVFIAGNHDYLFERDPYLASALHAGRELVYLEDMRAQFGPLIFYGSPWQPRFCDWAFNEDRGSKLARTWSKIPDDTDVLLTHGPPKGILDECLDSRKVGCSDLLQRVKELKPLIHAFGHIHEAYGWQTVDDTLFINASNCDRDYDVSNKPIVIDYSSSGALYRVP